MATVTSKKLPKRKGNMRPLFDGAEWTFELIRKVHDVMGEIALGELGLDIYGMRDALAKAGLRYVD